MSDTIDATLAARGAGEHSKPWRSSGAFSVYAWALLAYVLAVILFGAWVRITGSGAGCGDHWPTCHGEIVPRAPSTSTLIEYTHRVTSGLLGPLAIGLCVWAFRLPGRRWDVRSAALLSFLFIGLEGLIGAGLVLGELVADDDSLSRAVVIALHLGNTLILTAAGALAAYWGGRAGSWRLRFTDRSAVVLLVALLAIVLVSMSGAVTALGDTLFPVDASADEGVLSHLREDLAPGAHFLVQLRILHPILAIGVGLWLAWYFQTLTGHGERGRKLALRCAALTWFQLCLGALNIGLRAPAFMQLAHLLTAQTLWICLVLLVVERASVEPKTRLA